MTKKITEHEGKKYLRVVYTPDGHACVEIDVYAVLKAFGVTCPARAHAIKKLLCCGQRGKGTEMDDLKGVEAAVARAVELQQQEDGSEKWQWGCAEKRDPVFGPPDDVDSEENNQ